MSENEQKLDYLEEAQEVLRMQNRVLATALKGLIRALPADFAEVVRQMQAGRIPTAALNTHRGALADAPALLPDWSRPEAGVIKAILDV